MIGKKLLTLVALGASLLANDIIVKQSSCSVDKTVENFQKIVTSKGLKVFTTINHQENAKKVGMKFNESQLIIFGNAKLGTLLMGEDVTVGLDLPLKVLVYKDKDSKVKIAYRNGTWLAQKHTINAKKKIAKVNGAMDKFTTKAGQCTND